MSVACSSCGSILDATDPNLAVLQRHERAIHVPPKLPLGTRGVWHGTTWEAIGFQQVTITVEEVDYSWCEYVLFNPFRGFLYLSEYLGHWNVIEKLHERPQLATESDRPIATLAGRTFKHFQTSDARTTFALGEFPWQVQVGDTVMVRDYIAPPFMLSAEASDGEVTWSLGTYTPSDAIRKAFGVEREWPQPSGVYANQPNPHTARSGSVARTCGLLLAALVAMLIANIALSDHKTVFERQYTYERTGEDSAMAFVTEPFDLSGRPSNVGLSIDTDADNNWVFLSLSLINEVTGDSRETTQQVSYYHGQDSDGSWSEGTRREHLRISSVPAGRYFLRVAAEGGEAGKPPLHYTLRVRRDEPGLGFYALALVALVLPAFFMWIPASLFEQRRWAESDYAPESSSESDGEDDE